MVLIFASKHNHNYIELFSITIFYYSSSKLILLEFNFDKLCYLYSIHEII